MSAGLPCDALWARVQHQLHHWQALGAPADVMSMIEHGVVPVLTRECRPYDQGSLWLAGEQLLAWQQLEHKYLGMGAIVRDSTIEYINKAFLFPKSSGGYRLIVDMREFNACNAEYPTEMDTLHTLARVLRPGDLMSAFDLQDGYFHLRIHPDYQHYFGFCINGVRYRMVALPFGWSGSPQAFMTFTRAVGAMLHRAPPLTNITTGVIVKSTPIRHRILIDDFLLMFSEMRAAAQGVVYVKTLLAMLGLGWHPDKSDWEPSQRKHHLGLVIDTAKCMFFIPPEKLARIRSCAKLLLSEISRHARWVPARTLAQLCGLAQCVSLAFKGAHFFTRCMYDCLTHKSSWGDRVKLSNQAVAHVRFFSKIHSVWDGKAIWPSPVTAKLEVDASDVGWAARAQDGQHAQGFWRGRMARAHIMARECMAVYHGLSLFVQQYQGQVVDLLCDNVAVVYGLHRFTSRSGELMQVLQLIFWLCHRHNILIVPRWIPSDHNTVDDLSRRSLQGEWGVRRWVFAWLQEAWGPHTVDRFASGACHVLGRFNSAVQEPGAEAVDGLQQDWLGENNYCHPPVELLGAVVRKLRAAPRGCGLQCTVVVPDWPTRPWYVPLLMMAKAVRSVPAGVPAFRRLDVGGAFVPRRAAWGTLFLRVQR
jgi:hypothetical protein